MFLLLFSCIVAYLLLALHACHSTCSLGLSNTNVLSIPYVCNSFGACSVTIVAPTIWNSLTPALWMYQPWHLLPSPQDRLFPNLHVRFGFSWPLPVFTNYIYSLAVCMCVCLCVCVFSLDSLSFVSLFMPSLWHHVVAWMRNSTVSSFCCCCCCCCCFCSLLVNTNIHVVFCTCEHNVCPSNCNVGGLWSRGAIWIHDR